MSYDISFYRPEFLQRAIAANLGDWTDADPISPDAADTIIVWLLAHGYVERSYPWSTGRCFSHPRPEWRIEANLFSGSLSFSVSYGPESTDAIQAVMADGRNLAKLVGLAFVDPHSGRITT